MQSGRPCADRRQDRLFAVFETFGDDRLVKTVALTQVGPDMRIGAVRRGDGDARYTFLFRGFQQAEIRCLRDGQAPAAWLSDGQPLSASAANGKSV